MMEIVYYTRLSIKIKNTYEKYSNTNIIFV